MFDKAAIVEALKELARVAVIAVIPILISGLSQNQLDLRLVGVTAVIAVLRAIDKWVHENPSIKANGLLPF